MCGLGVKISGKAEKKSTMDAFVRDVSESYRYRRSVRAERSSAETEADVCLCVWGRVKVDMSCGE